MECGEIILKEFLLKVYNVLVLVLILYVSGWLMCLSPIIDIATCNSITGGMVAALILKLIFAAPVGKIIYSIAIWIAMKLDDRFNLI